MALSRKARAGLIVSLITGATVVASSAAAAPASPWREVGESARGRAAADKAASLFAEQEVRVAATDLRVYDVGQGGVLVVPRWVRPESFLTRDVEAGDRIVQEVEASVVVGLRSRSATAARDDDLGGQLAAADSTVAAAPYWKQYESGCFAWLKNGGSYLAPCYYVSKLIYDGSTTRDYFALRQKASIGTQKAGSANFDGWISSVRTAGSATQYWEDWDPGTEIRANCGTVELAVAAKGVVLGISATACERWEPTLWEAAGSFRNKWNCDCWFGVSGLRQVASNIAVSVPQGKYPNWTLAAGFRGW